MKKWIHAAVRPWKVRYEVHWLSPDGRDCLLAGSNNLDEAVKSGQRQAQGIFESPFETDDRKFLFLKEMYIFDTENNRVVDTDLDDYTDDLMSELDSRMKIKKMKSINSSTDADGWEKEYSSELETTFYIKELNGGSATIQEYSDDGDWGYNVVIRYFGTQRIEKSFPRTDLSQVKAWVAKKIRQLEAELDTSNLYGVSYWLQDGTQTGATIAVVNDASAYDEIMDALVEMHGDDFGGIADYFKLNEE